MFKWYKAAALVFCFLLPAGGQVNAQAILDLQGGKYCGIDLDSDGDYDGEGEIASCDNGVCPLTASECLVNRVHQVCEEDTQVTSCAPDEIIETCEPDTTTRQCDPDITNRVCEPDTTRQICGPDTEREECDAPTSRRVCDPDTTRRVCDPATTRRDCDPPTTRRECESRPPIRNCSTGRYKEVCETVEVSKCPFPGKECNANGYCFRWRYWAWKGYPDLDVATCTVEVQKVGCYQKWEPGKCTFQPQPDICRNVTVPGQCRTVTVPGQCRTVTDRGQCRTETIPGQCRTITVPGACHNEIVAGACTNIVTPGECRDIVIPGECTSQTIPGKCTTVTEPGECRDEPLPDECPLEGVDECRVGSDGISRCSDTLCVDTANFPIENTQNPRTAYVNDGRTNAAGECIDNIQVFSGRGMDCQKAGLLTLFKNCCKNRGEIIRDTGGSLSTAVLAGTASVIFEGASAAFSAFTSGATAAGAASAGTAAISAAAGPAFIAVGAAYLFAELLGLGCDQQDMETGMLAGSGLCHYVGTYCSAKLPFIGCIQKVKSHCCFNSKLGRIIHEQGRGQLKGFNGWGTPKEPRCEGFTPEQFQALNFADIDLSEYYGELEMQSEAQLKTSFEEGVEAYIRIGEIPDE